MTFTTEVFDVIQKTITLKNNKTKRRLKAKITETLEAEINDSVIPSYFFSVLTSMMDLEIPDDDIDEIQPLIKPICRKYTIENIPCYLAEIFQEEDICSDEIDDETLKQELENVFLKSKLYEKETSEICDYCCTAMGIVASGIKLSYNKKLFDKKIKTILFDTINCEEEEYDSDEDDEEFLQVLQTDDMIDIDDEKESLYTDDESEEYSEDDEEFYQELEDKQKEINSLRKENELLKEEIINLNHNLTIKNEDDARNINLIIFGLTFGAMYLLGPAYLFMKNHPIDVELY